MAMGRLISHVLLLPVLLVLVCFMLSPHALIKPDVASFVEHFYAGSPSKHFSFQAGRTKGYMGLAFSFTDIPAGGADKVYWLANSVTTHRMENG